MAGFIPAIDVLADWKERRRCPRTRAGM